LDELVAGVLELDELELEELEALVELAEVLVDGVDGLLSDLAGVLVLSLPPSDFVPLPEPESVADEPERESVR
jgi:hypothetical protein